jgi:sortase A
VPTGDDDDPISERTGALELVAREEHGRTGRGSFPDELVEHVATPGVETGVRLVEQPQVGVANEHGGERGPPTLSGRQPADGHRPQPRRDTRPLERDVGTDRAAGGSTPETDVLRDREVLVEAGSVTEERDVAANGSPITPQVVTENDRLAPHDWHQSSGDAQQGRLTGTIGALKEDDLTPLDVEIDAGERREPAQQADRGAEVDSGVHQDQENGTGGPETAPKRGVDVRKIVNRVGRVLVGGGVLVLLFVVYQLWGTNIQEARSQHKLRAEFERELKVITPTTVPGEPPPPIPTGDAVAMMRIPKIGVEKAVIEGVGVPDLKKGPGHYPSTPLPGQPGNAAIAGHRTTYGAPFYRLDELQPGDDILVRTHQGSFKFKVDGSREVAPSDTSVLQPTTNAQLTLTTCTPRYSAKRRLIVTASLVSEPAPAPIVTVITRKRMVEVEVAGLSGEHAAAWPTFLWASITTLFAIAAWFVARRFGRLRTYPVATPVFLVFLYFTFENVARLLPANI